MFSQSKETQRQKRNQPLWKRVGAVCAAIVLTCTTSPLAALADTANAKQSPPPPAMPPHGVRKGPKGLKHFEPVFSLSADPTDTELSMARIFLEPLIPMNSATVAGENRALAVAVTAFKSRADKDDASALDAFVAAYPKSRWTPSLQLNLGSFMFDHGFISKARDLWLASWNASKDEKSEAQKSVADRAIAELLLLHSRLGNMEQLKKYQGEIAGRN